MLEMSMELTIKNSRYENETPQIVKRTVFRETVKSVLVYDSIEWTLT